MILPDTKEEHVDTVAMRVATTIFLLNTQFDPRRPDDSITFFVAEVIKQETEPELPYLKPVFLFLPDLFRSDFAPEAPKG